MRSLSETENHNDIAPQLPETRICADSRLVLLCTGNDEASLRKHIESLKASSRDLNMVIVAATDPTSDPKLIHQQTHAVQPPWGIGGALTALLRMTEDATFPALTDSDVLVLTSIPPHASSPTDAYQAANLRSQILKPEVLRTALRAFSQINDLGMALCLGTPCIPLNKANNQALGVRLATQLGIAPQYMLDSFYLPIPLFFARGALVRSVLERLKKAHDTSNAAFPAALELGFHALTLALGYTARDLRPVPLQAPVETYLQHLEKQSRSGGPAQKHPEYCDETHAPCFDTAPPLNYIAYYLPQFHAIPENDRWWGEGFTEWTNVTQAVPRFIGHHQPRLPEGQGFYDLSNPEVMRRQVQKARRFGIHGFCFYFYWFNGKTLLERPLQDFLADRENDFPFCLCWANENWTRRWDGQEQEVLIEQSHSARDDLNFIAHIAAYLKDPRYIRVAGKPLLLVYRASLLDNARETVARWRKWCKQNGVGDIYVAAVLSFDIDDPRPFGFDAGVEFPPHQLRQLLPINDQLPMLDPDFSGEILDYRETVLMTALDQHTRKTQPDFPLLRGVMTGWDNDARRKGKGRVFHHATPSAYANWLRLASSATRRHNPPDQQYLFINAWNEWAEGAHLEPDRHFGHAYLAATANILGVFSDTPNALTASAGTSSGALHYLPAGVRPGWDRQATRMGHTYLASLPERPHFTVVLIVDQALSPMILDTLTSLAEQSYRHFSLHLLSTNSVPLECWFDHPDIPTTREQVDHPEQALQAMAGRLKADWLVLLRAGDRLLPHALLSLATGIAATSSSRAVVSDELQHPGQPEQSTLALLAPPTLTGLRVRRLPCGLLAVRADTFSAQGGFDPTLAGALEADYLLRLIETHGEPAVLHLPEVVLWRNLSAHPDLGLDPELAASAHAQAVRNHLVRCAIDADLVPAEAPGVFHLVHRRARSPHVSIVIPTHNQAEAIQRCIESLFANTAYAAFELLVVDHDNDEPTARAFLDGLASIDPERIRVIRFDSPFNYAAINNAAARVARGEYLLFLNDDTAALHPEWLDALVDETCEPAVAVVGARLVFPDGRLQHAGIALGMSVAADFPFIGHGLDSPGPDQCLAHVRQVSAVSGACMLVRRADYERVAGMDERFAVGFADVDLCLRLADQGMKTVWTPRATLMHEAGRTLQHATQNARLAATLESSFQAARQSLLTRWHKVLAADPHLNPNRSLVTRQLEAQPDPFFRRDVVHWHPVPNLLALPADASGSGEYRVAMPARLAHAAGQTRSRHASGYPQAVLIDKLGVDTIHTQRQVDDEQLATLAQIRATLDVRVVMDFDDLLTALPKGNIHAREVWPDIERRVREACSLSDTVTASTLPLTQELCRYHDDVRCIPNSIDPAIWHQAVTQASRQERRNQRLRIGWAGGISHAPDLKVIETVVRSLAEEVDWVFLGMTLDTLRPCLAEFHHGVPIADYARKLAELDLDLAIAPLAPNRFNECKSNLRLLEYGALGIPVIATDIVPYQCGLPVTLVDDRPQSWIRAIRERIGEFAALQTEGEQLRAAVLTDWTIDRMLPEWLAVWR